MENLLVNLLIAGALLAMDQVHRVSHQGIMVSREDIRKVGSCRRFLTSCEDGRLAVEGARRTKNWNPRGGIS
jgi:hypothetical protein